MLNYLIYNVFTLCKLHVRSGPSRSFSFTAHDMSIDHDLSQKHNLMSCANVQMTELFKLVPDVTAALPPTAFLVPIFFVHCIERQEFLSCNVGFRRYKQRSCIFVQVSTTFTVLNTLK